MSNVSRYVQGMLCIFLLYHTLLIIHVFYNTSSDTRVLVPFDTPYSFRQKRSITHSDDVWSSIDKDYSKPLPKNYDVNRPHIRWTQAEVWLTGLYKALHYNNDTAFIKWPNTPLMPTYHSMDVVTIWPGLAAVVEGRENIEFIFQELKSCLLEKKRLMEPIEESLLTLFDWDNWWFYPEIDNPTEGLLDDTGRKWPISEKANRKVSKVYDRSSPMDYTEDQTTHLL